MGKYTELVSKLSDKHTSDEVMAALKLAEINELAEANRLKRLELSVTLSSFTLHSDLLKDQA